MDFDKVITERYSVRKFNGERLTQRDIDEIIKAGCKAPTGCNYQPQRILVLNSKESIEKRNYSGFYLCISVYKSI